MSSEERRKTEGAALWRAEEAAAATGGALSGGGWTAGGVEIDTRALKERDLFVALRGEARDGHDFIAAALEKGAAAALATHRPEGVPDTAPLLLVEDTLSALTRLGAAGRRRAERMKTVAVTGSVGKTSTKEMLGTMFSAAGPTHAAVKSFNNHIGVPLTLARTPPETEFGVYEIGMNAPGEISPLARLTSPDIAIITTVEAAHLEAFDSLDAIADEKAAIFEGLREGGVAILNADLETSARQAARARDLGVGDVLDFGAAGVAARLLSARIEGDRTFVESEILGRRLDFEIGAPGRHFAMNALGALLAAERAGAGLERSARTLRDWRAASGRGARSIIALPACGEIVLVDESYNANPASLKAALATFAAQDALRRVAFITDMLELGPMGPALHAEIAAAPGMESIDAVHTAGPLCEALHEALPPERRGEHHPDAAQLAQRVGALLGPGDAAMVKGSLGSRAAEIAAAIRAMGAEN